MATKNDITGDPLITKSSTDSYRDGWDRIFGKKKEEKKEQKKHCGNCDKCKCPQDKHDDKP